MTGRASAAARARPPGRPARQKSGMMADMSIGNGNSKRLVRTLDGRMIAGVCSGLAEYTGLDLCPPMVERCRGRFADEHHQSRRR